jgi:hypothetical protein
MKTISILFGLILLSSCNRPERVASPVKSETPKALQESSFEEIESFSDTRNRDLVDDLYREQLGKRPDLKEIEELIEKRKEEKIEAANDFESYNGKIEEYYTSANMHLQGISDSLLKTKMLIIMNESNKKYQNKSTSLKEFAAQIKNQSLSITDYHEALKVIVTIPIIEKYQNDNRPNDSIYRNISHNQKDLLGKMRKKVEKPH